MLSVRFRERFTAGARMGRKGDNRENTVRFYRHFYGEEANEIFCTVFVGAQNTSVHGFHGLTLLLNDRLLHIRESYNTDSLLHAAAVCTRDTHAQHSFMQYFSTVKTSIYNARRKTFQSAVFAKCPKGLEMNSGQKPGSRTIRLVAETHSSIHQQSQQLLRFPKTIRKRKLKTLVAW